MAQDGGSGNNNSKTQTVPARQSVPRPTDASMGVSGPSANPVGPAAGGAMTYPDGKPVDMNNPYEVSAATLAWQGGGQPSSVPSNSDGRPVIVSHPAFTLPEYGQSADRYAHQAEGLKPYTTTVYAAREQLNAWRAARAQGDPTYDNVVSLLHSSGILGPRSTANSSIDQAWADALGQAAYNYAQRPTAGSDVFTYLRTLSAKDNGPSTSGGSGSRGGGGGGAAPITDSINLTDPGSAKLMLNQALSNYLGRKASEDEIAKFTGALTKKEMENPNHVAVNGQTQVQSGGFNPQAFADSWASGQKGVPEFQAATTMLDTFIGSLQNPTKVV